MPFYRNSLALAGIAGVCLLSLVGAAGVLNPHVSVDEIVSLRRGEHVTQEPNSSHEEEGDYQWLTSYSSLLVPLVESGTTLQGGVLTVPLEPVAESVLTPLDGTLGADTRRVRTVFTKPTFLAEGVMFRESSLTLFLKETLYDERLDGIAINPSVELISRSDRKGHTQKSVHPV